MASEASSCMSFTKADLFNTGTSLLKDVGPKDIGGCDGRSEPPFQGPPHFAKERKKQPARTGQFSARSTRRREREGGSRSIKTAAQCR